VCSAVYYCNGSFEVLCIVEDITEMEQLGYFELCRILLKWSSWGTLICSGYY